MRRAGKASMLGDTWVILSQHQCTKRARYGIPLREKTVVERGKQTIDSTLQRLGAIGPLAGIIMMMKRPAAVRNNQWQRVDRNASSARTAADSTGRGGWHLSLRW